VTATPSRQLRDNWDEHWDRYALSAEENPAQKYRREVVFSMLDLPVRGKGARILDIGSGQGDMIAAVHGRYPEAELLGVELSQSGVAIASRKVPEARFVQRDLLQAVEPGEAQKNWATHAICSEVIEHIDDPGLLMRNARQYMASGCRLALTAPGGPMSAFDKHIGHRTHWRPEGISRLLRDAGYEPESVSGAGFPFFNLYRCVVILRGRKLIDDVSVSPSGTASPAARAAMAVFHRLLRLNLNSSRWGWQMIAQARVR
jgi:SAM-dependent methyltransferase